MSKKNTMRERLGGCKRRRERGYESEHAGVCCEIGRDETN